MRALRSILLLGLLASCGDGEGLGSPYLEVKVAGIRWRETATDGTIVHPAGAPDGPGVIFSSASRTLHAGKQVLSLGVPIPAVVGTASLGDGSGTVEFMSCPNDVLADCIWWVPIAADPGTLEITSVDQESGRIRGTFSFPGYALGDPAGNKKAFVAGSFDIRAPGVVEASR